MKEKAKDPAVDEKGEDEQIPDDPNTDKDGDDASDNQEPKKEETPKATIDYVAEKIVGLVPGGEYTITDGGISKVVIADAIGTIPLEDDYYGDTISIIKNGDDDTTEDSDAQNIPVSPVPGAPSLESFDIIVSEEIATISGITPEQEYSIDNGETWIPGDGNVVNVPAGTDVWVRDKAADGKPASDYVSIATESSYQSEEAVDQMIMNADTDSGDPEGSTFGTLRLKATGKNKSVKLNWKKVKEASDYIIYGSKCGTKMQKLRIVKGASKTTWTQKKLKKGTYYKYIVAAYKEVDGKRMVIATSKSAHSATTGGKVGNPSKVKVKSSKLTIKKGRKKTIKASYVASKRVKVHIAKFRYESSNPKVATVTKKGVVKAKSKGKTNIYVYAQNGYYKIVKVTVK